MGDESDSSPTKLYETNHQEGPIAESVIEAIAEVMNSSSTEIEPLYESIDPDALEDLFDRQSEEGIPTRVEFRHKGFSVAIEQNGRITVYEVH